MLRSTLLWLILFLGVSGTARGAEDTDYTEATVSISSATVYGTFDDNSLPKVNLFQGNEVRVIGKKGERYFIRFQKESVKYEGWIDKNALKLGRTFSTVKAEKEIPAWQIFPGIVLEDQVPVYQDQFTTSRILGYLKRNEPVDVLTQTTNWFKLKINLDNGTSTHGWAERSKIRLLPKKQGGAASIIQGDTPKATEKRTASEVGPSARARGDVNFLSGVRFFLAPVFHIRYFEASQVRIGTGFDFPVTHNFSVGVPISLTGLDGFSSVQGGVDFSYNMTSTMKYQLYSRLGLLFDRFWGNGRSLHALTADLGVGGQLKIADKWAIYLEPGVEYSFWVSEKLPSTWFMRGQVMIGGRYFW